jgi:ABC-2 type transport system permease protein
VADQLLSLARPADDSLPTRWLHLAGLYLWYLRIYARTLLEYRVDTLISLATSLLQQASWFLFLSVLVNRVPTLAGWAHAELLFIFGFATTARAISTTFLNAPFGMTGTVRSGELDVLMVRPVGPLFQIIGLSQQPNALGIGLTGIPIMLYAAAELGLAWTAGTVAYLALALICGAVIRYAVLMVVALLTFWWEMRSLLYPMMWLYDFVRFPIDVFSWPVRVLLTYVIPFSVAGFFPAAFLLRPHDYGWALWGVPATTLGLVLLVQVLWSAALRHYESTGT